MVCAAKLVDVGEYVVPVEKVNKVLETIDQIRRETDYAIAIHAIRERENICILVELLKIHLPLDEFHRVISAPICEAVSQ